MDEKNLSQKATELEAREVAEAAREKEWAQPSFLRDLFMGRFHLDLIHPHPEQDPEEAARGAEFIESLAQFIRTRVDSEAIDREGKIPEEIVEDLRRMGAFGIKILREYGGLGFSQLTYNRAMELVSSQDGSLTALLSAHQSIGVPQPLKLFGTPEQKKKYFPRLARGAISAFALTETDVGFGSGQHVDLRHSNGRRQGFRSERRKTVVHQWHARGASGRDGANAIQRGQRQGKASDHGFHCRGRLARR